MLISWYGVTFCLRALGTCPLLRGRPMGINSDRCQNSIFPPLGYEKWNGVRLSNMIIAPSKPLGRLKMDWRGNTFSFLSGSVNLLIYIRLSILGDKERVGLEYLNFQFKESKESIWRGVQYLFWCLEEFSDPFQETFRNVQRLRSHIWMNFLLELNSFLLLNNKYYSYLPTPPLGQDMTQEQFLSGV